MYICVIFLINFFVLLSIYFFLKQFIFYYKRNFCFRNFDQILIILESARSRAYDKIYRERVLSYNSCGFTINKKEIDIIQGEYLQLVLSYCGPYIRQDLICIYGNLDTICLNIISEFVNKLIKDETEIKEILVQKNINDSEV